MGFGFGMVMSRALKKAQMFLGGGISELSESAVPAVNK